jgi:hypothetical protein
MQLQLADGWKQAELAGVEPGEVSFVASFNLQG